MNRTAKSGVCLLSSILLASCVTTNDNRASTTYVVPSNYRQLVARKVIEGTAHIGPIRGAAISQPAERFVGLVNGGTRLVVCATTTAEGRFIPTTTRWLVLFENGQIASAIVNPGAIYCAGVPEEPFPEVVKRT
jgi:hypothetical protein